MNTQQLLSMKEPATTMGRIVCRGCGRHAEIDCVVDDAACLSAADEHGFVILQTEVVYRGRCPDCCLRRP